NYVDYFAAKNTNRNAKKILLKNIETEDESSTKREFSDFNEAAVTTAKFLQFLAENPSVKKELDKDELTKVTRILSELLERLRKREWSSFSGWKEIYFLNSAIRVFRREVARKTGMPAKPTTTGFRDYAMNRVKIEMSAGEVVKSANTGIPKQTEQVGSLGSNKGILQFQTEFTFQSGAITDSAFTSLSGVKKVP